MLLLKRFAALHVIWLNTYTYTERQTSFEQTSQARTFVDGISPHAVLQQLHARHGFRRNRGSVLVLAVARVEQLKRQLRVAGGSRLLDAGQSAVQHKRLSEHAVTAREHTTAQLPV